MRYAMCWFPLIGVVLGGLEVLLWWLCSVIGLNSILTAAFCTALPILLTGGIHLDGFCDTVDARSSHQSRERKLEILKDPHIGAFGVIYAGLYLLVQFGLFTQIHSLRQSVLIGTGYVLSRGLSALALMLFKNAKASGTAHTFAVQAQRKTVLFTALLWVTAAFAGAAAVHIGAAGILFGAAVLLFGYYRLMSYRQFGGITGDLAGWFLQLCELGVLGSAVLSGCLQWI